MLALALVATVVRLAAAAATWRPAANEGADVAAVVDVYYAWQLLNVQQQATAAAIALAVANLEAPSLSSSPLPSSSSSSS